MGECLSSSPSFILLIVLGLGLGGCLGDCLCFCCLLGKFLGLALLVREVRLPVVLRHMVKVGGVASGDVPWRTRVEEPVIESLVSKSNLSPNVENP